MLRNMNLKVRVKVSHSLAAEGRSELEALKPQCLGLHVHKNRTPLLSVPLAFPLKGYPFTAG